MLISFTWLKVGKMLSRYHVNYYKKNILKKLKLKNNIKKKERKKIKLSGYVECLVNRRLWVRFPSACGYFTVKIYMYCSSTILHLQNVHTISYPT